MIEIRNAHKPVTLSLKVPKVLYIYDTSMRLFFYLFPLDSAMAAWATKPVTNQFTQVKEINLDLKKFLHSADATQYRIPTNGATKENIVGIYTNTQM